jgi:dihydrofolate reductase
MRRLFSFLTVSLDGFVDDVDQTMSWVNISADFDDYAASQLRDVGVLVFGRTTYEGMEAFWTTEEAAAGSPVIAARMNALPKVVASRTLDRVGWQSTTLVTDAVPAIRELKDRAEGTGDGDIAVFGSTTLTCSLIEHGLVDELRVMVMPVLLGAGLGLFTDLAGRVDLQLLRTTAYASGNVLLCYRLRERRGEDGSAR